MVKFMGKILVLFGIISFLIACNNNPYVKEYIEGEDFIFSHEADINEVVDAMIEISDIKKGGYVVLLPFSKGTMNETKKLKRIFYKHNIIAIHILENINDKTIKNTDVLTIENAGIICIIGKDINNLKKSKNQTQIVKSITIAKEEGALISINN